MSRYNSVDIPDASPYMSSLAKEGIILHNYYSMLDCTPARASLMTGRYPIRTGMQHECLQANSPWGLSSKEVLLPEYLGSYLGYTSHMVGKWDLGHFAPSLWPQQRGFSTFMGLTCYGYTDYSTHQNTFWGHDVTDLHDGFDNIAGAKADVYSTYLFGDHSVDIVTKHDPATPLFIYHAWNAVHNDLSIPADFAASAEFASISSGVTSDAERTLLAGALFLVDGQTKKVVDALKAKGMYANTYLIVASDNGGNPKDGGNNYPLRGAKKTLYEGGVRVPAFVHSPLLPPSSVGSVFTDLFHVTDWLPTIVHGLAGLAADTAGLGKLPTLDGVNQFGALLAPAEYPTPLRSTIVLNLDYVNETDKTDLDGGSGRYASSAERSWCGVIHTIGGTRYKLMLSQEDVRTYEPFTGTTRGASEDGHFTFLYDLSADPFEMNDLIASEQGDASVDLAAVVATLAEVVCDHWTDVMVSTRFRVQTAAATNAFKQNDNFVTHWVGPWTLVAWRVDALKHHCDSCKPPPLIPRPPSPACLLACSGGRRQSGLRSRVSQGQRADLRRGDRCEVCYVGGHSAERLIPFVFAGDRPATRRAPQLLCPRIKLNRPTHQLTRFSAYVPPLKSIVKSTAAFVACGSVCCGASRNFPVLCSRVPKRWPISEVGDYCRLIGRFSVVSIGHTSKLLPAATGFLVSVSGFSLLRTPRAHALIQPTKARRAAPACVLDWTTQVIGQQQKQTTNQPVTCWM